MKKLNSKQKLLALTVGIAVFVLNISVSTIQAPVVYAVDSSYTLLEPLPCVPSAAQVDSGGRTISAAVDCGKYGGAGKLMSSVDIKGYIQYMFNLFIAVAAVTAIFMIVLGGFEYMTTDAIQNKADGLKKIQNAVYGLLMVLCSFLILRTINPQFVAIPDTLVAPLELDKSLTTASLTELLSTGVDTSNSIAQAALVKAQGEQALATATHDQKLAKAKELAVSLGYDESIDLTDAQITSLLDGAATDGTPEQQKMAADLTALADQEATQIRAVVVTKAQALISSQASYLNQALIKNNSGGTEITAAVAQQEKMVDQIVAIQTSKANLNPADFTNNAYSNDPAIVTQAAYTKATMELAGAGALLTNYETSSFWGSTNPYQTTEQYLASAKANLDTVTDPTQKAEISAKITAVSASLATLKTKNCKNTSNVFCSY